MNFKSSLIYRILYLQCDLNYSSPNLESSPNSSISSEEHLRHGASSENIERDMDDAKILEDADT